MPSSACCPPRHPHSFPTRRSSDLGPAGGGTARARPGSPPLRLRPERHRRGPAPDRARRWRSRAGHRTPRRRRAATTAGWRPGARRRSEEHTSELQSLRHLVCRLLLAAPPDIPTLSLHDALPISDQRVAELHARAQGHHPCGFGRSGIVGGQPQIARGGGDRERVTGRLGGGEQQPQLGGGRELGEDRKSTRLNSSHLGISYAVFCLLPPPTSPLFPYTTLFRSRTSGWRNCTRAPRVTTPAASAGAASSGASPRSRAAVAIASGSPDASAAASSNHSWVAAGSSAKIGRAHV